MKKKHTFFRLLLVWLMVVQSFVFPLQKAHAAIPLAVVAVGAVIAATGVMVAGAGVYKPPTFAQVNAVADAVTGDIQRKVVVARAFGAGVSATMRGFQSSYTLDFQKAYDWIQGHPADYPALTPATTAATVPVPITSPPGVGNIFKTPDGVYRNITNVGTPSYVANANYSPGTTEEQAIATLMTGQLDIGGRRYVNSSFTMMWYNFTSSVLADGRLSLNRWQVVISCNGTGSTTANPLPTSNADPRKFAPAYPNTQAGQDETDKIAAQNPSAIKAPPQGMTSEQILEGSKQAAKDAAEKRALEAEEAAAADPTNIPLQIAAKEARAAADQAAIVADAAKGELETKTPAEEVVPPVPAVPATPAMPLIPTVPDLDFMPPIKSAMDGLTASLVTHEPFASLSTLPTLFDALTAPPVSPVIDVEIPHLGEFHVDLSVWDTAAAIIRAGAAALAMIGLTFFVLKVWV